MLVKNSPQSKRRKKTRLFDVKLNYFSRRKIPAAFAAIIALTPFLFNCALQEVFNITGDDVSYPSLLDAEADSKNSITLYFSESVTLSGISTEPSLGESSVLIEDSSAHISFETAMTPGENYTLSAAAENDGKNTLSFEIQFTGYNDSIPDLIITEVRTEYSKPKVEFIELYTKTAGNLGGVAVSCASNKDGAYFSFPNVEVPANAYIVLHMRSLEDGYVDDIDGPDSGSGGSESSAEAWDFWFPGNTELLRKTDVVLVEKSAGKQLLAALPLAEGTLSDWSKEILQAAAERAVSEGVWESGASVSSAVRTNDGDGKNGVTATRTVSLISLDSNPKVNDSWKITATGGATPGYANNVD